MSLPERARAIQVSGPLRGEVRVPGSKSSTNRALLLAALSVGASIVRNSLDSGDTRLMVAALRRLGAEIRRTPEGALRVEGCGGRFPADGVRLECGNAGTVLRFLTAAAPLGGREVLLDGDARMRHRPIGDLTDVLSVLGVSVSFRGEQGFPPVALSGRLRGGKARLRADRSSQFASGLLMAAPCTVEGVEIELVGRPVSAPYLDLTAKWMARFHGPAVRRDGDRLQVAGGGGYRGAEVTVDGDASAAAAILTAVAATGGSARVTGLRGSSAQPDAGFPSLLERMGCRVSREEDAVEVQGPPRRGIRADLTDRPDLAPSLAALALFAEGPTTLTGAAHLRWKESDRIADLAAGLRALGARVDENEDGLTVHPAPLRGARLDPCRDHRLAMAFAAIGLVVEGVEVEQPSCVGKSFPGFFEAIDRLRPGARR